MRASELVAWNLRRLRVRKELSQEARRRAIAEGLMRMTTLRNAGYRIDPKTGRFSSPMPMTGPESAAAGRR